MDTKFTEWLNKQLKTRGMSMRALARRGEISHTSVSNVLAGKTDPTADFCLGIARALRLQPSVVLHKAGHLSFVPNEKDPTISEAMALFNELPAADQKRVLLFMKALEEAQENEAEASQEETSGLLKPQTSEV